MNMIIRLEKFARLFGRDKSGVAAVEFAIIAPILFMMLFGVLETGRVLYTRGTLQSGLEVAGRYAMVHANVTASELEAVAWNGNPPVGVNGSSPSFRLTSETIGGVDFHVLTATLDHEMTIPFVSIDAMELEAVTLVPKSS